MSLDPDIFGYLDACRYLRDYYVIRHRREPKFSHRFVAGKLGRNTPSYFTALLKGTVRFSDESIAVLAKLLGLDSEQSEYFHYLCLHTQAKGPVERSNYHEKLMQFIRIRDRVLEKSAKAYYGKWHHPAMRALLDVIDHRGEPEALGALLFPPISPRQARQSFALLRRLGLIRQEPGGAWKPTDRILWAGPRGGVPDPASAAMVRNYEMECLKVVRRILWESPALPKKGITETMSVSPEAFKRIAGKLAKFRNEVMAIVRGDPNPRDSVYHLHLQLVPQSRKVAAAR